MSIETLWLLIVLGLAVSAGIFFGFWLRKQSKSTSNKKTNPSVLFGQRRIQDWEREFAWLPVETLNGWVWLKPYWARKVYLPTATDEWEESFTYQKVTKLEWYLW